MKRVPLRIGVTGSPGTGKKSIGLELARMTGLNYLNLNELAIKSHAGMWAGTEFEVRPSLLKGKVKSSRSVVTGHLLPYVVPRGRLDCVVVLRTSPRILRKRYLLRGYPDKKINENIESELLDLILAKSISTFGSKKVFEFDTSRYRNPKNAARSILSIIQAKKPKHSRKINWAERAARSPRDLSIFLSSSRGLSESLKKCQKTEKDN